MTAGVIYPHNYCRRCSKCVILNPKKVAREVTYFLLISVAFLSRAPRAQPPRKLRRFTRWQKILLIFACLSVAFFVLAAASPAQAGLIDKIGEHGFWMGLASYLMITVAQLFVKVALFFLSFILEISAYNGYLNATAVEVGWVMVRDFTNMFFVVALLIIAFGTILGLEQYEWKKLLVKFVIAAILVNFSRVIVGVLIDISQLVMTTFVNGIAATAGGNLINGFNLDQLTTLSAKASAATTDLQAGIFTASLAAVVFAGMLMMTLGIFVFMLLARVIRLWILIVLSPIAFVLNVLPATQNFAKQWWTELGDDLVTGPVLLFFIWLSFVTIGTGQVNQELAQGNPLALPAEDSQLDASKYASSIGIGDAMGWNKMANFAIAIGMLLAGARVAQTIGGSSGSALTRVSDFGKKVTTIASGYAVGRWAYEGGKGHLVKGLKTAAYKFPVVGGRRWEERWHTAKTWAKHSGELPAMQKTKQVRDATGKTRWINENDSAAPGEVETGKKGEKVKTVKKTEMRWNEAEGQMQETDVDVPVTEQMKRRFGLLSKIVHGGAYFLAKQETASEKRLEKTKSMSQDMGDLLKSRVGGAPKSLLFFNNMPEGFDRMIKGMLEQEKARSAAKTTQYTALGRQMVAGQARQKYSGFLQLKQKTEGKQIDEVTQHQVQAETVQKQLEDLTAAARQAYQGGAAGKEALKLKMQADLRLKAEQEGSKLQDARALAGVAKAPEGIKSLERAVRAGKEEALEKGETEELRRREERKLMTGGEGKRIAGEEARQKVVKGLEEAKIKKVTSAALADKSEAMKKAVQATIAEERGAKLEETKVETLKKEQEEEYLRGPAGRAELGKEAELKAKIATAQAKVKTLEAQEKTTFEKGAGAGLLAERKLAELELQDAEKEYTDFEGEKKREQMKRGRGAAALAGITAADQRVARGAAEEKKLTEEAKAKFVAPGAAGERLLKEQKEFEIESGLAQAKVKGAEEKAKLGATVSRGAQVQLTKEQEIETARLAAFTKELEEAERLTAVDAKQKEVAETKQAEIRTAAEKAEIDKLEEQAKEKATKAEAVPGEALERIEKAKLEKQDAAGKVGAMEAVAARDAVRAMPGILSSINLSEQAKKGAEDFVKELKSKHLQEQFEDAAKTMAELLKKSGEDLKAEIETAQLGGYGSFVAALASGQRAKLQEETSSLRRRQAEDAATDAFVFKPNYNTTSPSVAYVEYTESKEKNYRRLERVAAMKKAAAMRAALMYKRSKLAPGEELALDQKAELQAATRFLGSQAWNDDEAFEILGQFEKLQKHLADPSKGLMDQDEEKIWKHAATQFAAVGWLKPDQIEADGSIKQGVKIDFSYDRSKAADLQDLALTGGDVQLVQMHHKIDEEKERLLAERAQLSDTIEQDADTAFGITTAKESTQQQYVAQTAHHKERYQGRQQKIEQAAQADSLRVKQRETEAKAELDKQMQDEMETERNRLTKDGQFEHLEGRELKQFVDQGVNAKKQQQKFTKQPRLNEIGNKTRQALAGIQKRKAEVLRHLGEKTQQDLAGARAARQQALDDSDAQLATETKTRLEAALQESQNEHLRDENLTYWKVADKLIKKAGGNEDESRRNFGVGSADELVDRYKQHSELLQDTTKDNKEYGHQSGHTQLGGNQDQDEEKGVYRFMTRREAQKTMRDDQVKMKTRELLNKAQFHSFGTLNGRHNVIDDMIEEVLGVTLGRVKKQYDLGDVAERTLKGWFYLNKNEDARRTYGTHQLKGKTVAKLGGEAVRQKMVDDGQADETAQTKHMLTRGVLAELLSGPQGFAVALGKLYGHVKEGESMRGVINLQVGNQEFANVQDLASYFLGEIERDRKRDRNFLAGTRYEHELGRVKRQLQDIKTFGIGESESTDEEEAEYQRAA